MKNLSNIFLLLSLTLLSCSDNKTSLMMKVDDPKPVNFSLYNLNYKVIKLDEFEGSYILVNFWATWCKPCVNEIPSLNNLNENFSSNDDFQVVAINIGQNKDVVENFLKSIDKVGFLILLDEEISLSDWNVQAIPTTFLLNKKGKIIYRVEGEKEWDSPEFISFINSVMQQ